MSALPSIMAYGIDGQGNAIRLDAERLDEASVNPSNFTSVHLRRDDEAARNWLATSGRDGFVIDALTAEETGPRRTFHGDRVMLNLLGIDLDHGAEPKDMFSVRLGLEGKRSIGIWVRALQAVRNLTLWIKRTPSPLET